MGETCRGRRARSGQALAMPLAADEVLVRPLGRQRALLQASPLQLRISTPSNADLRADYRIFLWMGIGRLCFFPSAELPHRTGGTLCGPEGFLPTAARHHARAYGCWHPTFCWKTALSGGGLFAGASVEGLFLRA